MATLTEKIVFLNDNTRDEHLCFVCGHLFDTGHKIVDATTSFLRVPLPNKLGDLVGDEFCIVVSKFDEICNKCFRLIDEVDSMEEKISNLKKQVLDLLEVTYSVKVNKDNQVIEVEPVLDETDECLDPRNIASYICFNDDVGCHNMEGTSSKQDEVFKSDSLCSGIFCEFCSLLCETIEIYQDHIDKNHKSDDDMIASIENSADTKGITTNDKECVVELIDSQVDSALEIIIKEESIKRLMCPKCSLVCFSEVNLECHLEKCGQLPNGGITVLSISPNILEKDSIDLTESLELKNEIFNYQNDSKRDAGQSNSDGNLSRKKTLTCDICGVPFVSISALARHTQVHQRSEGPVICHICGKECHDNLHALYHRRNEHNVSNELTCGICNASVETAFALKKHILLAHRGKKEFRCVDCGKTFTRSVQYENHRLYSHGNNHCRICKKHIADPVKLRQHEHRHARTDMKKFECEVCKKTFKTPGGLRVHKVSHTGKYKFFCEFCGRGFLSNVILEEHKGVHTKEERYVCDICGRKFVLYSTFHLHRQWHQNPYPFPCRLCGRKFRYRSERANHVRRDHTGEMPHKCPYCDAAFIKSSYLKKHLTGHTQKYPYNCDVCERGFDQKKALAKHMSKCHEDNTLLESIPKKCQYKVALRPEEYPEIPK